MVVVEDVEVGCMACVGNKRKRMGANSMVSAQPALPSDSLGLPQRRGQAQSETECNKRIQTQKRWSRKKCGQNCDAYAALSREDGPARGGGQGDSQETVAGRFKCAVRTIQSIKQNRKDIQKQADTARCSRKSNHPGEFKGLYSAGYALYRRKSILCGCPG